MMDTKGYIEEKKIDSKQVSSIEASIKKIQD